MKYLKYFTILFVLAVSVSIVMNHIIKTNTPPFILNKLEELKINRALMDSIGGFSRYEYSFNKEDFKQRDTVKYSIKIKGHTRLLIYKGVQLRTSIDEWKLIDESLLIE